jgi:hypothetical protein
LTLAATAASLCNLVFWHAKARPSSLSRSNHAQRVAAPRRMFSEARSWCEKYGLLDPKRGSRVGKELAASNPFKWMEQHIFRLFQRLGMDTTLSLC